LQIWRGVAFRTRLDELVTCDQVIERAARQQLETRCVDLRVIEAKLGQLNPAAVFHRGFSILTDQDGGVITTARQVIPGSRITAQVNDGTIAADVIEVRSRAS
jgi:exonuclease VII large subunit